MAKSTLKSKRKVNATVQIKGLDWYNHHKSAADGTVYTITVGAKTLYVGTFTKEMSQYCGQTAVITTVIPRQIPSEPELYKINLDGGKNTWTRRMFAKDKRTIK